MPTARISGIITDADDEPIEGVQLQILFEAIADGHKYWRNAQSARTDEDGAYRIVDIEPGRYLIFAIGPVLSGAGSDFPPQVYAPVFYPEAPDFATAQPVEIQSAQDFRADFRLRRQRAFSVSGVVSGLPAGIPFALNVQNSTGQLLSPYMAFVDNQRGQFLVPALPPGDWALHFTANSQGNFYTSELPVSIQAADLANLNVFVHPNTSIPVKINQPPDAPAIATVLPTLSSDDPFSPQTYMPQQTDHGLEIKNVAEGKYKLNARGLNHECVESAYYGDTDLLRDYLVVGPDTQNQAITLNLRSDCATLTPQISSEQNYTSGILLITSSNSFSDPITQAIESPLPLVLPPGAYQVFAFTTVNNLEYTNPDVLRQYPSQSVTLTSGQTARLTVKFSDPHEQ